MQHSQLDGAVKGRRYRVIIRIQVEYEQYFIYGRADRKVNDGITFEQSHFSKIHESKTSEYHADPGIVPGLDGRDQHSSS